MLEKITLVCTSLNPDRELLSKMIDSAKGFYDIIIHEDKDSTTHYSRFDNGTRVRHVYNPEHLTIDEAYNWIIKDYVKTEWICCFCDDDYFYPGDLKALIDLVHKGVDADIIHFPFRISGHRPWRDYRSWIKGKSYIIDELKPITPKLLSKHNRLPAASFFRKSAWEKVGGFQGDKCHDWNLWLRMSKSGFKFKRFSYIGYNHVRRENSAWCRQNA